MTDRPRLDRLRASVRRFRDASARRTRAEADYKRAVAEVARDLRDAEIPPNLGFEEGGLVVWWEASRRGRDRLGSVELAHYRGQA